MPPRLTGRDSGAPRVCVRVTVARCVGARAPRVAQHALWAHVWLVTVVRRFVSSPGNEPLKTLQRVRKSVGCSPLNYVGCIR